MNYSEITDIKQLTDEKLRLKRRIAKQEKRLDTSLIIAKRHTKDLFSFPLMLKSIAGKIISIHSLLSSRPATLFEIGSSIGRRLFSKKK